MKKAQWTVSIPEESGNTILKKATTVYLTNSLRHLRPSDGKENSFLIGMEVARLILFLIRTQRSGLFSVKKHRTSPIIKQGLRSKSGSSNLGVPADSGSNVVTQLTRAIF